MIEHDLTAPPKGSFSTDCSRTILIALGFGNPLKITRATSAWLNPNGHQTVGLTVSEVDHHPVRLITLMRQQM